eukprot:NODE_74_length_2678_cov_78.536706_g70_i0.p4 GENE.NODE_74_length_2678_cov_78.536706_g70_i0~~NODE_74_length_2678_cov_78.536706_g70_i0.p4  ORF type:complete len:76 (+),score=1.61 NODE_74_length_2678_cov_78.536706_g70_i0:647-874(+)
MSLDICQQLFESNFGESSHEIFFEIYKNFEDFHNSCQREPNLLSFLVYQNYSFLERKFLKFQEVQDFFLQFLIPS